MIKEELLENTKNLKFNNNIAFWSIRNYLDKNKQHIEPDDLSMLLSAMKAINAMTENYLNVAWAVAELLDKEE